MNPFKKLLRAIGAMLFGAMVITTVSVQQVHFLFSDHEGYNEQCKNHLHAASDFNDCALCNFNVLPFTDNITVAEIIPNNCYVEVFNYSYQSILLYGATHAVEARGPPAMHG